MKLVKPTLELKESFYEYLREWEKHNEKVVPTTLRKVNDQYEAYVKRWQNESQGIIREGWVANTTYFLVNEEGRILGSCNMRHELNKTLLQIGGHVGYGVRPTERGKGYATFMLKECLRHLKKMGIQKALITCNDDNIGSKSDYEQWWYSRSVLY
ncbi:GNAT family N-acetyltransferase [Piscibacillus salipiscarius]|uniref:GNAT family N-acetyltransferase n=1 Tax=Piscibacillus salipiscarius TaxID=299480 RepID=UPI0006D2B9A0|nr:GNAT family N-acetyltransferase [Piscibacillus salipiscarius]